MKFLELNKKRHATKHFNDKAVDPKDVRMAIEIATLAPSAHNSQPWKFVVVRERNADLAEIAFNANSGANQRSACDDCSLYRYRLGAARS